MDIAGFNVPLNVPSFGVGTGNIIWVLVILMFTFVGAIVIYLIFQWKIYSKKIIVIETVDRDMRYMSVAIRKNIQERYRKQGFMEKYGTVVMNGIFLLIMLIGIWFLLDKLAETSGNVSQAVASANKVQEASQNIISSLNNICGGSGIKSAING